jgi:hypothetical protein
MPHAAQIAGPFLAHIGDEQNICPRFDPGRVHRPQPRQQHREAACVIANTWREQFCPFSADLHVCARRKNRVEMRRDTNQRTIADAAANSGDIALGVDLQFAQAVSFRHFEPCLGALGFLKRGRFNFRQPDDVFDGPVMLGGQYPRGPPEPIAVEDPPDGCLRVVCHTPGP